MSDRDLAEEMLILVLNSAVDALKAIPPGDPSHVRASRLMIEAKMELEEYRKKKKKR